MHEQSSNAELKGVAFARGAQAYQVTYFLGDRPVTEDLFISLQRNGSPTALLEQLRAGGMRLVRQ